MNQNGVWGDFQQNVLKSSNLLTRLIVINIALFLVISLFEIITTLFKLPEGPYIKIWNLLALSAYPEVFITRPWTIITYMFMHSGIMHILMNMLVLYWFGRILQDLLGSRKVLTTYLIGGIAGGLLYMVAFQLIPYYQGKEPMLGMVGASASVLAIIAAAATLAPTYRVYLLFFGAVKLVYIAIFLIAIDLLSLSSSNAGGHVAHIGGAIYGYLFIRQLKKGTDTGAWLSFIIDWIQNIFNPKAPKTIRFRMAKYKSTAQKKEEAKSTRAEQEKIDLILDKIARSGYESLTEVEKDILFRASKK